MGKSSAVTLARVLKTLVTLIFVCNLIVLPLVPGLAFGRVGFGAAELPPVPLNLDGLWYFCVAAVAVWGIPYVNVLTAFLLFCGCCTAVILWQARRVLKTIVAQNTFVMDNAKNMKRAAVCCFLIGFAALARTVWGFAYYRSIQPLFTYNALFVPLFVMGGLLCMVMSALFRQAAELKEENDLTI